MGKSLFLMVKSCLLMDLMLKSPANGCFTGPFIGSPGRTRCFGSGVSTGRCDFDVPLQNAKARRYSITIQNGEAFTRKNGRCSSPMCEFFRGFPGKNKDSKSVSFFAMPTIYIYFYCLKPPTTLNRVKFSGKSADTQIHADTVNGILLEWLLVVIVLLVVPSQYPQDFSKDSSVTSG